MIKWYRQKKPKLYGVEVLISKGLIDSNISNDFIYFSQYVLKEFDNIKKDIKNSNDKLYI